MFGKNPLDLPQGRKLSREEIAEALRLAITAELDAVNFYLQLARAIEDERIKRVFEDIAREEKTHMGEFLALLKTLDEEQVVELEKGEEEVEELTGLKPVQTKQGENTGGENPLEDPVKNLVKKTVESSRQLISKLPVTRIGRGVDSVSIEVSKEGRLERIIIPLREVAVKFRVSQKALEAHQLQRGILEAPEATIAGINLARQEEEILLQTLLEKGVRVERSDWSQPGQAVIDVARAIVKLASLPGKPLLLVVNPVDYTKLLVVDSRTGLTDLDRIKQIVSSIVYTPLLPEGKSIIIPVDPDVLDVVYGGDAEVDYIGPENGYHVYRVWSTIAVRVRNPEYIIILG